MCFCAVSCVVELCHVFLLSCLPMLGVCVYDLICLLLRFVFAFVVFHADKYCKPSIYRMCACLSSVLISNN